MELHGSPSAGRSDDLAKRPAEEGFSVEQVQREYFAHLIEVMEEEREYGIITQEMPRPAIVKYHDILEKMWGWDRLLPMGNSVSWSEYTTYLKEYHRRNVHAVTKNTSIAALAVTIKQCHINEGQLASELKILVKPEEERRMQMRKSSIVSCLIRKRACSVIHTAGCSSSDVCGAALLVDHCSSNTFISHLVDAPMAEAMALKEGLMLAQYIGGNRICVQTDCLEVCDIMNEGFTANSAAAVYDECFSTWNSFEEISIQYMCREANQVAHELAKQGFMSKVNYVWDDDPPDFIIQLLANDVTVLE